jgi:phosphohistidine phosphatase SixA
MSKNGADERFVILVRHASRVVRWDKPDAEHTIHNEQRHPRGISDFETKGEPLTYALAGRLCDALEDLDAKVKVKKIICGEHLATKQTAKIYRDVIKKRGLFCGNEPDTTLDQGESWLNPNVSSQGTMVKVNEVVNEMTNAHAGDANPNTKPVCILVGHQPYLTEIARHLLKGKLPGDSLPLDGSEAACLRIDGEHRLCWLITEKPKDLLTDLKDKIKSKYDVAKFFLGAFVVNTGLILNAGVWGPDGLLHKSPLIDKILAGIAIFAILVSLGLTAATLFSYDRLMMPERFWSGSSEPGDKRWWERLLDETTSPAKWSVSRPPSQAQVVLFYEMVHVWKVFFIPAVLSAFAAVGLLIVALMHRDASAPLRSDRPEYLIFSVVLLLVFVAIAALAFLAPSGLYDMKKPRLGVDD